VEEMAKAATEEQLEALLTAGFTAVTTLDGLRFTRVGDLNAYPAEEALAALASDEDGEEETS